MNKLTLVAIMMVGLLGTGRLSYAVEDDDTQDTQSEAGATDIKQLLDQNGLGGMLDGLSDIDVSDIVEKLKKEKKEKKEHKKLDAKARELREQKREAAKGLENTRRMKESLDEIEFDELFAKPQEERDKIQSMLPRLKPPPLGVNPSDFNTSGNEAGCNADMGAATGLLQTLNSKPISMAMAKAQQLSEASEKEKKAEAKALEKAFQNEQDKILQDGEDRRRKRKEPSKDQLAKTIESRKRGIELKKKDIERIEDEEIRLRLMVLDSYKKLFKSMLEQDQKSKKATNEIVTEFADNFEKFRGAAHTAFIQGAQKLVETCEDNREQANPNSTKSPLRQYFVNAAKLVKQAAMPMWQTIVGHYNNVRCRSAEGDINAALGPGAVGDPMEAFAYGTKPSDVLKGVKALTDDLAMRVPMIVDPIQRSAKDCNYSAKVLKNYKGAVTQSQERLTQEESGGSNGGGKSGQQSRRRQGQDRGGNTVGFGGPNGGQVPGGFGSTSSHLPLVK